jgi:hypothetical protein
VNRLTTQIAQFFARRNLRSAPRIPVTTIVRERIDVSLRRRLAETEVRERINRVFRRRLSDRVTEVFDEACISGDLDTAEELLVVLEAMHVRRQAAAGERRIGDEDVVRARDEFATRNAERRAAAAKEPATV